MTVLTTLPPAIRSYLDDFVARKRRLALWRAAGVAVATFILWMLVWCGIDRFAHLPGDARLATLAVGAAIVVARMAPSLVALRRRPDLMSVAAEVERENPRFAQRLVTVTSRVLGSNNYRGSDEILLRLMREVDLQVAAARPRRLVSIRSAIGPWALCLLLALGIGALLRAPELRFRELAERFLNPLSPVPPVTTTRLIVAPGNLDVVQSQPLTIEVQASRLGDSPVTLHLNDDEKNWSRVVMTPAGAARFTFALAGVDRDLRYYVTGGDARSPDFLIRVLRRPTVAQFRIRYDYPAYTRLSPTTVSNTDGRIDAPAGTRVLMTVQATEPLQVALLTIGNDRILMEHSTDACSRQADLVVRSDMKYSLDLISTREVAGAGPPGMSIRAIPDLPPQVRLSRGGDSLRLNPRDIVPIWYEALDDYGLKSLVIRARINGQAPVEAPIQIWGDPRRQQDVFNFDLATLPLGIGDTVSLTAVATDTAGGSTESSPLQVLISPRSVDLDAYERISELHNAAQLAASLASQLEDAAKAQAEAQAQKDHQSAAYLSAASRADRGFSAASQTATLLRQALLRATTHSHSPQLSVALAGWVDAAERQSTLADDAFRQGGAPGVAAGAAETQRERLRAGLEQGHQLQQQLAAVEQGEQAAAVLADYENLQATEKRPPPADEPGRRRLRETIERIRQDIAAEAGRIGLNAGSGDLESQLKARIAAEQQIVEAAKPVDFIAAARDWAQQMQRVPGQRLGLEGRLSAAAQAEAIRPDADLIRARDLEASARAVSAINASARNSGRLATPGALNGFVADLEALARLRSLEKHPEEAHNPTEVQLAREAANKAQQDMARSAGDPTILASSATRGAAFAADDRQKDAERLALQASAAAASHQYPQAAELDQALQRRLQSPTKVEGAPASNEPEPAARVGRVERHQQAVQREMSTARQLDDLGQEQQRLAQQSATERATELAGRQQNVAERIAQVENQRDDASSHPVRPGNGRDRAAAELLSAQEQLSTMPQQLALAQAAAASRREATMRAGLAANAAKSAPPDQRDAAQRAAQEAEQNARDAQGRLTVAMEPVSPRSAQIMADRLETFAPETDGARASILGQLAPALQSLRLAAQSDDGGAVDRAASESRKAIEACQRELSNAQELLVQRDPLVAARWFAKAAAESLSLRPPDLGHARSHQADASAALSRAWDQSIHRAAAERLSAIPSLAAVLDPPAPATAGTIPAGASKFAAAREWGRLRPQEGPDLNSSMHDADPPGYEESLKLYFEALGKAQEVK